MEAGAEKLGEWGTRLREIDEQMRDATATEFVPRGVVSDGVCIGLRRCCKGFGWYRMRLSYFGDGDGGRRSWASGLALHFRRIDEATATE